MTETTGRVYTESEVAALVEAERAACEAIARREDTAVADDDFGLAWSRAAERIADEIAARKRGSSAV